jgi:hypothetical protein
MPQLPRHQRRTAARIRVASIIGMIVFFPLGILMMVCSLAAIFIGAIVAVIAKPGHVYCMECKQVSKA